MVHLIFPRHISRKGPSNDKTHSEGCTVVFFRKKGPKRTEAPALNAAASEFVPPEKMLVMTQASVVFLGDCNVNRKKT